MATSIRELSGQLGHPEEDTKLLSQLTGNVLTELFEYLEQPLPELPTNCGVAFAHPYDVK